MRYGAIFASAFAAAASITALACSGGRSDASADSAVDTARPLPGDSGDSARPADSVPPAPGTVRDSAQPQPQLPSGSRASPGSESKPGARTPPPAPAKSSAGSGGSASEDDSTRLLRLETEARALAKVDGCGGSDQCRSAPVGHRPCGGPRTFLAYCARTTDSTALFRKLEQLAEAERAYNAKRGIGSTCDMRMAPPVEESGGRCSLRTAQPGVGRVRP